MNLRSGVMDTPTFTLFTAGLSEVWEAQDLQLAPDIGTVFWD